MYSVSKTSKACARPEEPWPNGFEMIKLTKNHTFNEFEKIVGRSFDEHEVDTVVRQLFRHEWSLIDHEDDMDAFFRHNVAVFKRNRWYLCVRADEVFEK